MSSSPISINQKGGDWKTIYDYALQHDFRFLSYGDSSLLFRSDIAIGS